MKETTQKYIVAVAAAVFITIPLSALIVKLCWNRALVHVFPVLCKITFWQSVALLFLFRSIRGPEIKP